MHLLLLSLVACEGPDKGDTDNVQDPLTDDPVGDSGVDDTGGADTGDTDTGDTSDTDTGQVDTDTGEDTGDSGTDTSVDTDTGGGGDTGDTGPTDTGASGSDTGPGPDPDMDQSAALPKWHKMWGGLDLPVRIDGRASFDPYGGALAYAWTATNGTFDDDTSATPYYTGGSGTVTLTVTSPDSTSEPYTITIIADTEAATIPTDYATVDQALLAGETILILEPGTYGAIDGAEAVIGDPDGGVVIDAEGASNGVTGASYLRHLTITGADAHGVYADTDIRMHDVVIEGNGNSTDNGGGLWANAVVIMHDTVIQNNTGYLGGGIYLERTASLYAQQDVIADNTATYGGGIYTNTTMGNVTLWNTLIVGNTATDNGGGGIFLDSRAFFSRVTVADNTNGGIRLRYGYFEVDQTVFGYNTDYAVQEADGPTVHFTDSVFGTTDIIDGGASPDPADGNISGDAVFEAFTSGSEWAYQDFRLATGSPGLDLLTDGQDRDGSDQDVGAYGGFLGRLPSGEQGVW